MTYDTHVLHSYVYCKHKSNFVCSAKVGPVAFENTLLELKEKLQLSWFVGADEALEVIICRKITEDLVETISENVNNACIDESVCIQCINRFLLKMHGKWFLPYLTLSNRDVLISGQYSTGNQ